MSDIHLAPEALEDVAEFIRLCIVQNTLRGTDMHGKPFEPYSSRPFKMPLGAYYNYMGSVGARSAAAKRYTKQGNKLKIFRSSSGTLWAVVEGGYLAMKRARFKTGETRVNLSVTGTGRGGMLDSIGVVAKTNSSITIGFTNERAARIASYHQIMGAGKSRVIRQFFGITPQQKTILLERLKDGIVIDWGETVRGV